MLSKLRIRRNRLRPVKPETLARWWLYETNSTPVEIQDGDKVYLTSSVYQCSNILKEFHTLKDALAYVRKRHYATTY